MRNNIVIAEKRSGDTSETMVSDDRDHLTPAELVLRRLDEMAGTVPGSRGRLVTPTSGRRPERGH